MTWLSVLSETYKYLCNDKNIEKKDCLLFRYTTIQPSWIILINSKGDFKGAREVPKKTQYLVPCTDDSPARTNACNAHPLCDNLQYIAGRYCKYFDPDYLTALSETERNFYVQISSKMKDFYDDYYQKLNGWCNWSKDNDNNIFVLAVQKYLTSHDVISDLVSVGMDSISEDSVDVKLHLNDSDANKNKFKDGIKALLKKFIVWEVVDCPSDWSISSFNMGNSWNNYYETLFDQDSNRYCVVSGIKTVPATGYPKKIRHEGDQAKLISSNDKQGLTFRGRFIDASETANISSTVCQQIHKSLSWLMRNVQFHVDSQYTVFWTLGKEINVPNCMNDDLIELGLVEDNSDDKAIDVFHADKVKQILNGKLREIPPTQKVYIMSVDSMTPGRLSVVLWEEIDSKSYFEALLRWCDDLEVCDFRNNSYIPKLSLLSYIICNEANKDFYNRILNSILTIGGIPADLMLRIFHRVLNPFSCKDVKSIYSNIRAAACLIKAYQIRNNRRNFEMSLDTECQDRSYLFGRLLAVADNIEKYVLDQTGENRMTSAMRLLQTFSERPAVTWKNIEKSIIPYIQRLSSAQSSVPFIASRQALIDNICSMFMKVDDFTSSKPLDPIFILGFHQQRCDLYKTKVKVSDSND